MGFFEEYVDDNPGGGSAWVTGEEKDTLLSSGQTFVIAGVEFDEKGGYDNADRFALDIVLNGAERKLSFQAGSVDSRDRMLAAMAEYLGQGGAPVTAKLTQEGRATLITAA